MRVARIDQTIDRSEQSEQRRNVRQRPQHCDALFQLRRGIGQRLFNRRRNRRLTLLELPKARARHLSDRRIRRLAQPLRFFKLTGAQQLAELFEKGPCIDRTFPQEKEVHIHEEPALLEELFELLHEK